MEIALRAYQYSAAIAPLFAAVSFAPAQCPPGYMLDVITNTTVCGILTPIASVRAVSEVGELCGGYGCIGGDGGGLFIWSESKSIPIPSFLGSLALQPRDLNSSRHVVGAMFNPNGGGQYRGFHYANGTVTTLLPLSGHNWSEAYRISASGIACGLSSNTSLGGLTAVVWTGGEATPLNLPWGPDSDALAISDTHLVTGWMGLSGIFECHAYIHNLNSGETLDVGTPLLRTTNARGTGVNAEGNICGFSYTDCNRGCTGRRGFIWSNGFVQDLGNLPGFPQCIPQDLNDSNVVIGNCSTVSGNIRPFVWRDGFIYLMDDLLISPPTGTIVLTAWSINNAGQIAANIRYPNPSNPTSFVFAGARLTPIPPLTGDLDCDWQVNVADLLAVIGAWGPCPPQPPGEPFTETCHADFNDDGVVNHHDIIAVVLNWTS